MRPGSANIVGTATSALNPNTIQHAFSRLEDQGLIVAKGTTGRFVTEDTSVIDECKKLEAGGLVRDFISRASELRISTDTIIEMILASEILV